MVIIPFMLAHTVLGIPVTYQLLAVSSGVDRSCFSLILTAVLAR